MAAIPAQLAPISRWHRIRNSMTRAEWRRAALLAAVVVGLHVVGFVLLFAVVVPHHYDLGASGVFGLGRRASPPTRSACGTRSTPTTSARSTTRRAS